MQKLAVQNRHLFDDLKPMESSNRSPAFCLQQQFEPHKNYFSVLSLDAFYICQWKIPFWSNPSPPSKPLVKLIICLLVFQLFHWFLFIFFPCTSHFEKQVSYITKPFNFHPETHIYYLSSHPHWLHGLLRFWFIFDLLLSLFYLFCFIFVFFLLFPPFWEQPKLLVPANSL